MWLKNGAWEINSRVKQYSYKKNKMLIRGNKYIKRLYTYIWLINWVYNICPWQLKVKLGTWVHHSTHHCLLLQGIDPSGSKFPKLLGQVRWLPGCLRGYCSPILAAAPCSTPSTCEEKTEDFLRSGLCFFVFKDFLVMLVN